MSNHYQQAMAQRASMKASPSQRLVATQAFEENGVSRAIEAFCTRKPRKARPPVTIKRYSWEA